jgi:ABC-2 type transport system ATP-binding protein
MRSLSGGMKRRVLVGQALVHKPPVIVLDEPTAGVDVELRQSLWQFIRKLNRDGHTIILTTHYLEEARRFAAASRCSRRDASWHSIRRRIFLSRIAGPDVPGRGVGPAGRVVPRCRAPGRGACSMSRSTRTWTSSACCRRCARRAS